MYIDINLIQQMQKKKKIRIYSQKNANLESSLPSMAMSTVRGGGRGG